MAMHGRLYPIGCAESLYLIQEQPTLEMVSAGSDTAATSSLNRSFSIRLIKLS